MNTRIVELEELIKQELLVLLPHLKVKKELLPDRARILSEYLDELRENIRGEKYIPRSLAYKLFYLNQVMSRHVLTVESEEGGNIQSSLYTKIVSIFNDNLYNE